MKTFVMLKPDALRRQDLGQIIECFKITGLPLAKGEIRRLKREEVCELYREHEGKEFYEQLIDFTISGPVFLTSVEGADAVRKASTLKRLIRKMFKTVGRENILHTSDSEDAALREIKLFGV